MSYNVIGTNTLTGCTASLSQAVSVSPSPTIYVVTDKSSVCSGSSANLTGLGGVTYTWSNGALTNGTTVSPTANTSYTVLGSNALGCTSQAVQMINVNSLPTVGANTSSSDICVSEVANLTATGALTYQWISSSSSIVYQGASISVSPNTTTTFTLTGTDANGCSNSTTLVQNVNECVGINKFTASANGVSIFPNPTSGDLTIETHTSTMKNIEVVDLSGRVVLSANGSEETFTMNMSSFANGVYYVKIQSNSTTDVVKIVKN
jgi:hypothetical protein